MNERRLARRCEVNREFSSVEEFIREYAMNVSLGGCFVRTEEVLPVGTEVNIKFNVVVEDFETIEGVGNVVRTVPPGRGQVAGMGVVFTSLTEQSRNVIVRLFLREGLGALQKP